MVRAFLLAVASILVSVSAALAQQAPLPEAGHSTIGYPGVEAAFQAVKADPKIKLSSQTGWVIGVDDTNPSHPAYPAAVRRRLAETPAGISMEMSIYARPRERRTRSS